MKELFYELIKGARDGKILIDEEIWPIGFNTIIYENDSIKVSMFSETNLSTLVINDEEKFLEKLAEYLEIEKDKNRKSPKFYRDAYKNHIKLIIAYLFVNATVEDFKNPLQLIDRNISFLKDNTFAYLNDGISVLMNEVLLNSVLEIKNVTQSIFMETPNKIEFSLNTIENNVKLSYKLPTISYGISTDSNGEKVCYIYSILGENQKSQINDKFTKKISRILYKLNKGIRENESQEYLDFVEGKSEYYPENISDVSPSAVMALTIFIFLLKKEGIRFIKGIPYLPLRYLSRNLIANEQTNENQKETLNTRNDLIQSNITDKFIRTFRRVAYYMPDLEVVSYPYEFSDFLEINIGLHKTNTNNQIITEVLDDINKTI